MTDLLKKNKTSLKMFIIDFSMIFITYVMFLKTHFSVDSYAVYFNMDADNQIRQTRFVNYFFIKFFEKIGFNTCSGQSILTMSFMIASAIVATVLTKLFCKYLKNTSPIKIAAMNGAVLISVVNVFILEWYLYPETMLFYALSLLLATLAIYVVDTDMNIFLKGLIIAVLIFLSLNCYQASMPVFVIYALSLILIKSDFHLTKKSFFESFVAVFSAGFSCVILLIVQKIFYARSEVFQGDRNADLSIETIIGNIKNVFSLMSEVFDGYYFIPRYTIPCFVLIFIVMIIYNFVKSKKSPINYIYCALVLIACFCITFVPHTVTKAIWFAPRTNIGFCAFLSVLALLAIYSLEDVNWEKILKAYVFVIGTFLIINIVQIKNVGIEHFSSNAIEREYALQIQHEINKYEADSGNHIDGIAIVNDTSPRWCYEGIRYNVYDTNTKAYVVPWGGVNLISYYGGRQYHTLEMDPAIYNEHFADKNWDYYTPEEQLVFQDNVMYMCVY